MTALPNQASYVAVKLPVGHGKLVPRAKVVPEAEAMRTITKLKPW